MLRASEEIAKLTVCLHSKLYCRATLGMSSYCTLLLQQTLEYKEMTVAESFGSKQGGQFGSLSMEANKRHVTEISWGICRRPDTSVTI